MGANSLVIVPSGFNPLTAFANYSTLGLTHTLGTTLTVPAGFGTTGSVTINDPVTCQGTITAVSGGTINLNNGLVLSGGDVSLGNGNLTVNDLTSGISGGSLISSSEYVGNVGTATFTQSGGANDVSNYLNIGSNAGSNGTYSLSGNGTLFGNYMQVGYSGTGLFTQSGGNAYTNISDLFIGCNAGSSGTCTLNGSGQFLAFYDEYIGYSGTGTFTQTGGTNNVVGYSNVNSFFIGYNAGSSGTYNLSGGSLWANTEAVGLSGTGNFTQTGGTNSCDHLDVGQPAAAGTYKLSGSGLLSAYNSETVAGAFTQTGGTNTNSVNGVVTIVANGAYSLSGSGLLVTPLLTIASGGTLTLSGGTLQISHATESNLINQGVFSGGGGRGALTLVAYSILDLSQGSLINTTSMSISAGPYSLVVLPAGFSTATGLASYSNQGITYTRGTTLSVPAGQVCSAITRYNSIEINDPFNCQGTFRVGADINDGFTISGTGSVSAIGNVTVNNANSSISGGLLSASYQYVGSSGTGTLTQSGGSISLVFGLWLGYNPGDAGTYNLNSGLLSVYNGSGDGPFFESIGDSGSGNFIQTGGTNSMSGGGLSLGGNTGASGTYSLSGASLLSMANEYVGSAGAGTFTQSGGTNIAGSIFLGFGNGGSGSYNINGGLLVVSNLVQRSGMAAFNFNAGTLEAGSSFSATLPMTLGASGSGATFDTAGYVVTLSDPLSGPGSLTKVDSGMLTLAATNTYSGSTLISGGTLALGSPLAIENSTLDTSGSGLLSFGSLASATFGGLTGPGKFGLSNVSSAAVALSVGNNNASTTFSGKIQGPGSLTKVGSGTLLLSGSNIYTGPTSINQGVLSINGSLVSQVTIQSGGVLSGTGYLGSVTVTPSGQIAPGTPLGVMNVSDSLNLESGAVMDYELDTPSTSDQVLMQTGELILSGQPVFDFTPTSKFGQGTYVLINAGSINGTFVSSSGTIDGYTATLTEQGNEIVLDVVPEPSTLALLGAGVVARRAGRGSGGYEKSELRWPRGRCRCRRLGHARRGRRSWGKERGQGKKGPGGPG